MRQMRDKYRCETNTETIDSSGAFHRKCSSQLHYKRHFPNFRNIPCLFLSPFLVETTLHNHPRRYVPSFRPLLTIHQIWFNVIFCNHGNYSSPQNFHQKLPRHTDRMTLPKLSLLESSAKNKEVPLVAHDLMSLAP